MADEEQIKIEVVAVGWQFDRYEDARAVLERVDRDAPAAVADVSAYVNSPDGRVFYLDVVGQKQPAIEAFMDGFDASPGVLYEITREKMELLMHEWFNRRVRMVTEGAASIHEVIHHGKGGL